MNFQFYRESPDNNSPCIHIMPLFVKSGMEFPFKRSLPIMYLFSATSSFQRDIMLAAQQGEDLYSWMRPVRD